MTPRSGRLSGALIAIAIAMSLVMGFWAPTRSLADQHGSIRIYKLNSKGQFVRQRWIRDDEMPGCHDLRRSRKVHRFAQVGFEWCTVYAGDNCEAGSELPAMWRGGRYRTADIDISQPQIRLLPGAKWFLHEDANIKMGSWECRYPAE